jgi:hypothetical protein
MQKAEKYIDSKLEEMDNAPEKCKNEDCIS